MTQFNGATSGEIDGYRYQVLMLDPLAASDILADLGYMLAPVAGSIGGVAAKERGDVFSTLMDGAKDEDGGSGSNIDIAIEKAVIGFFDRYSKEKQRELFSQLAKITMVIMPDGKEPRLSDIFQAHFRGRVKSMYRWFFFAMKTQFEDFFSGQDGAISRAVEKVMGTVGQPTS